MRPWESVRAKKSLLDPDSQDRMDQRDGNMMAALG